MNSNKYSELLEKYYKGLSSVEEERRLKHNAHLLQETFPFTEAAADQPVMNWNFDEFLKQANQPQQQEKGVLHKMRSVKYAAAVITIAILATALYYTKKQAAVSLLTGATKEVPAVAAAKEQPATDSSKQVMIPVNTKTLAKNTQAIVRKRNIKKRPTTPQKNDDFFVLVDGRRITDENEALAILQRSLNTLSGDMQQTMTGINNFPKLDVKFK